MTRSKKQPIRPDTNTERAFVWLRDWHCFTFLGILVLVFFRQVIFQNAFFWEDFIYQFYPFRSFASAAFARGEIPLWNPYTFAGMPFLADITGTVFYLPHFLLVPLVSGGKLSYWYVEMYIIAHFLLAGVTMFYCARHFGTARIGATFSALVYMFSGFMVLHVIHLVTICQAAWFPLVVLLFSKMLTERSAKHMVLAGFVLSMIVCGGHIQITLYFFFFLLIYLLVELWALLRDNRRAGNSFPGKALFTSTGLAFGVVLIAVMLAAIQILPTFELAGLSVRESITYAKSSEGQLYWQQLLTLLIPNFFGSANALWGENPIPYWGPGVYWHYWETALYTGFIALALALLTAFSIIKTNRRLAFVTGFAIFAILYALGDHFFIHKLFYNWVPGFNKFRSMGRWGYFVMFAISLLSGFGLQSILDHGRAAKRLSRVLFVLGGIVIAVLVGVKSGVFDGLILSQAQTGALNYAPANAVFKLAMEIVTSQSAIACVTAIVCSGILFLLTKNMVTVVIGTALVFLAQFADMYVFGFSDNNGKINPDEYFKKQATTISALKEQGRTEFFRVNARNMSGIFIDRNQGMLDGIFMTEGYSQLALQRRFPPSLSGEKTFDLLNVKYRLRDETVMVGNQPQVRSALVPDSSYLPRAFFVYRYEVFETARQESLLMASKEFDARTMAALEQKPETPLTDTIHVSTWRANIQSYGINKITVNTFTPKRGILVMSEIYYPGWNAYVDGVRTPVYRTDWSLRGLFVDAGEHTVELRFEPESFRIGAIVSLSTLFVCCSIFATMIWKSRRKSNPVTA